MSDAAHRTSPPGPAAIRAFDFPHVAHERFDGGLRMQAARHGRLPLVTAAVVIDAGVAGEPAAKSGLAHLTANALDVGTADRSGEELAWAFERLGVELETTALWDAVLVHATTAAGNLDALLALLADVVRRPAFPDAELRRLRDEQLATILQREKEPRALASDMAARFIFGRDVPYARPLLGLKTGVEALGRDDVVAFHRARFTPATTSLLLVGDVDEDAARASVRSHFGDWTGTPAPAPSFDVRPGAPCTTIFIVDRPGSVQSEIRIGQVGVPRAHEDYFALEVMNALFGGAFTSRLNLSLREKHGYTYGVRSGFAYRRAAGPFVIQTAVATDVTVRAVEEILRELNGLRADGASADEVDAARDYLVGILPLELQTTEHLAGRLADLTIYDLPLDYFRTYRARMAAVTPDDVARVARDQLRPDNLAIVVVGDAAAIADDLRAIGCGPVEVHRPEEP
jgi:zinc protease